MPESFNRGTAFGQGFSLTSNASSNRRQVALMEKRNQQEQQRLVREDFLTKMKDNIAIVAKHTQDLVPGMFTEQELAKPIQKRGNTRAHQSFVQTTWDNMLPAIEMAVAKGFISKDEAQIITKQYDIATTATDPRPAQDLAARGEQVGEQGKTLGKETAISSDVAQANRDADNARAIKLRQTQTSQNITTKDITKPTQTSIEGTLLSTGDAINRLRNIRGSVKEEYFKLWSRAGFKVDQIKSILGDKPSPEDAEALKAFQTFQSETFENFNLYVKSITGAAMSNQEAQRIEKAMPVSGEGVWPKQSYEQFIASLTRVERMMADTQIRYKLMKDQGLATGDIEADKAAGVGEVASTFMSHEEARRIYARRGDAIYQKMLGQYADENAAKAATKIALKREFGL